MKRREPRLTCFNYSSGAIGFRTRSRCQGNEDWIDFVGEDDEFNAGEELGKSEDIREQRRFGDSRNIRLAGRRSLW